MAFPLKPCPCSDPLGWVYKVQTSETFQVSLSTKPAELTWVLPIDFLSIHLPNLINLKVYSTTMKLLYPMAVSMLFANSAIQMATGLKCSSGCAACWENNNNNGVDTKFTCTGHDGVHCGGVCPTGYNGIHCAKIERCLWAEKFVQKTNNTSPDFQIGVILLRVVVMNLVRVSAVPFRVMNTYIADHSMQVEHVRPPEPQRNVITSIEGVRKREGRKGTMKRKRKKKNIVPNFDLRIFIWLLLKEPIVCGVGTRNTTQYPRAG